MIYIYEKYLMDVKLGNKRYKNRKDKKEFHINP